MRLRRRQILTIGPIVLVATCYAIAAPSYPLSIQESSVGVNAGETGDFLTGESLVLKCEATAKSLRNQLGPEWTVIARSPFVLGGDLTREQLEENFEQTIIPIAQALSASYFASQLGRPITILLCSSDQRFRECNRRLDDRGRDQYSGLYHRKHRRMIVNVATGDGTQAHELTHALAHADFPTMPEWFDEGLASLHEECEFSADGSFLIGNENWRNAIAHEALQRGELRLLEDVTSHRFASMERASTDYAHVRTLCLYLQERGLLRSFYQRCRENTQSDPTGLRSLCEIANAAQPKIFDDEFRAWLISRQK